MNAITVEQADKIIQSQIKNYGVEEVDYKSALGRVLAENLFTDRDLPPFDRATVDGIAIAFDAYNKGLRSFRLNGVQAAGVLPLSVKDNTDCIEIMTGAALGNNVDTVIRYEDIAIANGVATINDAEFKKGQNIHSRGKDKKPGDLIASAGSLITPALLGLSVSVGKTKLKVKQLPKVAIITTGNEIVDPQTAPTPYQLRRSNDITIHAALKKFRIDAAVFHLKDDVTAITEKLDYCLSNYDVLLLSGGVSMGKFDHIPGVLDVLGVTKLFHKVQQRPGKPFWFGSYRQQKPVFAFPGNPVSVFMCLHRYFIPWLNASLGISTRPQYAVLQTDISFAPELQYFVQVQLQSDTEGRLIAKALETNGSGDFSHLAETDAFMELPLNQKEFKRGDCYRIWKY